MKRLLGLLLISIVCVFVLLGTASVASAHSECKTFTGALLPAGKTAGTTCVHLAADHPTLVGRMHYGTLTVHDSCNNLMPRNFDAPILMIYCLPAAPIKFWKWTSAGWAQHQHTSSRVYGLSYPMGTSLTWRWIHVADVGWIAAEVDKTFVRWFVPTTGSPYYF